MKKLCLAFVATLISCTLWAQWNASENSFSQYTGKNTPYANHTKADGEMTVTWLTADAATNSYGSGTSAITASVFMELYPDDLLSYEETGKQLTTIKQVQFYIVPDYRSTVSSCKVILMSGTDITTATEVVNQTVVSANLVGGWNYIDLATPYTITDYTSQRIYIGYQIQTNGAGYPIGINNGTNVKQAWTGNSSAGYTNIASNGYMFMIKAVATTDDSPENEISLSSLENIPQYYGIVGDSIPIKGTVKNSGSNPLTSFKVAYEINGVSSNVTEFTGLNIAPGSEEVFTLPKQYVFTTPKTMDLTVTISEPNGVQDITQNNTLSVSFLILPSTPTQRVVLHEGFTSSTCVPCVQGNITLKNILNAANPAKWVCIKYQMNWPGTGDPYYTTEGGIRRNYYGVSSVPFLVANGPGYMNNTSNYTITKFNQLAQVPAAATTASIVEVNDKTVNLDITISPVSDIENPNLRFFAAIVEKRTTKNKKSNGETEFLYVMKKFMTSPYGDSLISLEITNPKTLQYSYTFNGNYRLPANANASNLINNNTENSVENFDSLMVVYWIQDIANGWIYQAGKGVDPDPHGYNSIHLLAAQTAAITIAPNPSKGQFTIKSDIPFTQITVMDLFGKTIKEIQTRTTEYKANFNHLAKGMYLLRIETSKGTSVQKIQIQ